MMTVTMTDAKFPKVDDETRAALAAWLRERAQWYRDRSDAMQGGQHAPLASVQFYRAVALTRLGYVAARTPPMPYRLLKLAEDHA